MTPTEEQTYREGIVRTLARIEAQTTKTNGRVSRLEHIMMIVGTITATLFAQNSADLLTFIKFIL